MARDQIQKQSVVNKMRQKIKSITKGNARLPAKQKGDNVNYKRIATAKFLFT